MLKNWRKERGVSTVGVGVVKSGSKRKEAEEAVLLLAMGNQPTQSGSPQPPKTPPWATTGVLDAVLLKREVTAAIEKLANESPAAQLVGAEQLMSIVTVIVCLQYDKEEKDPRGRTPLHLAVTLRRTNCVGVLLSFGANTLAVNRHQWSGMPLLVKSHL